MATQRENRDPNPRRKRRIGGQRKHNRGSSAPYARQVRVKTGGGTKFLTMLAVVAAVIFSVAVFFKVRTVEVQGNSVYDSQTVIDASGLSVGDNLLAVNKASAAGKIKATLPYVEQVRIARRLPDTIVLEISESDAVFTVKSDSGQSWLMSFSGKLLEQVSTEEAGLHPAITGFLVTGPESGKTAKTDNQEAFDACLVLLEELEGTGIVDKVSKLDVTKPYDMVLWYSNQFEVRLGGSEEMAYKIEFLKVALNELTEFQTGTIDLTLDEDRKGRFVPW